MSHGHHVGKSSQWELSIGLTTDLTDKDYFSCLPHLSYPSTQCVCRQASVTRHVWVGRQPLKPHRRAGERIDSSPEAKVLRRESSLLVQMPSSSSFYTIPIRLFRLMTDFEIKITREKGEVLAAQRLRFEVFHLEMKKGPGSSYCRGLDADDYDPICEHLIVHDLKDRQVVGTYRLLLGSEARKHAGFYSERDFDLEKIKRLRGGLLELGRSCVRKEYRKGAVINGMWQAIANYMRNHQVRYLFGCARLHTTHPHEVSEFFALLKKRYYASEETRVYPLPQNTFPDLDENIEIKDPRTLFLALPALIKGYLRVGALVCGPPALDHDFGTVYFFLLLDRNKMSSNYWLRFGFSGSKVGHAVA